MSKDSSAKYYQNSKDRLEKKLMKNIKVFLKKKKKKSNNMVMSDMKIYQKKRNKSLLSIEEDIKLEKCLIIITRNYFHGENPVYCLQVFLKECEYILKRFDSESSFDEG